VVAIAAVVVLAAGGLGLGLALGSGSHTTHPRHAAPSAQSHHATASSVITPSVAGTFNATYAAPARSYTVELDASGPCWVMATDAATNHVVWTGTMAAGERRQLPAAGGLVVHLGASGVAVSLDGKTVQLPPHFQVPFVLTFQPA
jgi:hypothetical protein